MNVEVKVEYADSWSKVHTVGLVKTERTLDPEFKELVWLKLSEQLIRSADSGSG